MTIHDGLKRLAGDVEYKNPTIGEEQKALDSIDLDKMRRYIQGVRKTRTDLIHRESNAKLMFDQERDNILQLTKANQARCPHLNTRNWGLGIDSTDHGTECTDCGAEL